MIIIPHPEQRTTRIVQQTIEEMWLLGDKVVVVIVATDLQVTLFVVTESLVVQEDEYNSPGYPLLPNYDEQLNISVHKLCPPMILTVRL